MQENMEPEDKDAIHKSFMAHTSIFIITTTIIIFWDSQNIVQLI